MRRVPMMNILAFALYFSIALSGIQARDLDDLQKLMAKSDEDIRDVLRKATELQNMAVYDIDHSLKKQADFLLQDTVHYMSVQNKYGSDTEPVCHEAFENFAILSSLAEHAFKDCIESSKDKRLDCALQDLKNYIRERSKLSNALEDTKNGCDKLKSDIPSYLECMKYRLPELAEEVQEALQEFEYVTQNLVMAKKRIEFESTSCFKKQSVHFQSNVAKAQHYFINCQDDKDQSNYHDANPGQLPLSPDRPAPGAEPSPGHDPAQELVTVKQKLVRLNETAHAVMEEFMRRGGDNPRQRFDKIAQEHFQSTLLTRYDNARKYVEGAKAQGLDVSACQQEIDDVYSNVSKVANKLLYGCSEESTDMFYSDVKEGYDHIVHKCKNIIISLAHLFKVCSYDKEGAQPDSTCGEAELPDLLHRVHDVHQTYWEVLNSEKNSTDVVMDAMTNCLDDRIPLITWEASNMEKNTWKCVHFVYSSDELVAQDA